SYSDMKQEIEENMVINGLSLDYEGSEAPEGLDYRLRFHNISGFDDGESSRSWSVNNNPANILLLPFQEELEEHNYDP
ncbi:MAG: hypothetical protein ABEK04_02560, partial [Candidatus Nanohalobium sp.]